MESEKLNGQARLLVCDYVQLNFRKTQIVIVKFMQPKYNIES